jgi:hypothetical protein
LFGSIWKSPVEVAIVMIKANLILKVDDGCQTKRKDIKGEITTVISDSLYR